MNKYYTQTKLEKCYPYLFSDFLVYLETKGCGFNFINNIKIYNIPLQSPNFWLSNDIKIVLIRYGKGQKNVHTMLRSSEKNPNSRKRVKIRIEDRTLKSSEDMLFDLLSSFLITIFDFIACIKL